MIVAWPGSARADYTDGLVASRKISMEAGVRIWRRAAWREDDFLSEVRLGDLYASERDNNKFHDPVEAYVWYYLATISNTAFSYIDDRNVRRVIYEDLHRAARLQARLLLLMTPQQREDARDRIVYILSCRGADGMLKLGQIHTTRFANDGGPGGGKGPDNSWRALRGVNGAQRDFRGALHDEVDGKSSDMRHMVGIASPSVIVPNDGEALMFFHIADNMGHPLAKEYIKSLDRDLRGASPLGARIAGEAEEKARYWYPPFEFYPPGDSDTGVPYTDECYLNVDRQAAMGLAAVQVPPQSVQAALWFLGWIGHPGKRPAGIGEAKALARYQQSIGDEPTGKLTAAEGVRLIQTAAIRGDAASQNALGVMYAKGIGVMRNYVRAEYWFQKAADQRYAAALYHLSVLYRVGPDGIKQDLSKSNDYITASALAGFRPTMNQLGELLNKAAVAKPRPGQH